MKCHPGPVPGSPFSACHPERNAVRREVEGSRPAFVIARGEKPRSNPLLKCLPGASIGRDRAQNIQRTAAMQSFLYMEGKAFLSLLFRQAKGCIKVGELVEPSATPSSGRSVAAPAKPCKASAAAMLAWLWPSRRGFCNARAYPTHPPLKQKEPRRRGSSPYLVRNQ